MEEKIVSDDEANANNSKTRRRKLSRKRKILFRVVAVFLGLFVSAILTEAFFRVKGRMEAANNLKEGTGFRSEPDERWGWRLKQGTYRVKNTEFDASGFVNRLYMNGIPYDPETDVDRTRVLIIGDSHTAAVGVSGEKTWVKVLERQLEEKYLPAGFRCYNASAPGYSLHQYLARLIDQGPEVKPDYVVVGFSFATDLYDLLPPDRGGWIYGDNNSRVYWDFDTENQLTERYWNKGTAVSSDKPAINSSAVAIRQILRRFATFNHLRRSKLFLMIGSKVSIGGQSLWPNMEVVLEKEINEKHQYQWDLALAMLMKISDETKRQNAKLIVVGIPYLAPVYDDIWESTFGGSDKYDRSIGGRRVAEWCEKNGIAYVETLDMFRRQVEESGRWLHHRKDAHPTDEGHELIADAVCNADLIIPIER